MTRTVDISGMDKSRAKFGYEWGCQVIMFRALKFLRGMPKDSGLPDFRQWKNITGLMLPENDKAKQLEDYALDHEKLKEFGATGAMVQFSLTHAMKRFELGDKAYLAEFSDQPERIFDFDEQDAFPVNEAATSNA